jgi:hypothetical protein
MQGKDKMSLATIFLQNCLHIIVYEKCCRSAISRKGEVSKVETTSGGGGREESRHKHTPLHSVFHKKQTEMPTL